LDSLRRRGSQDKHQVRGIGYKKGKTAADSCLPPRWKIQKSGGREYEHGAAQYELAGHEHAKRL
jgi:hypothetical protein